jgi:ribosomal protein S7
MGQQELLTTVRNLKELMMMKDELEAEIAAAQDTIKSEMAARETDEITVDVFKNNLQNSSPTLKVKRKRKAQNSLMPSPCIGYASIVALKRSGTWTLEQYLPDSAIR